MGRFKRGPRVSPRKLDLSQEWTRGNRLEKGSSTKEKPVYSVSTRRQLLLSRRRKILGRNRDFLFHTTAPKTQLEIISLLSKNGIYVPRLTAIDIQGKIFEFEYGGKRLSRRIDEMLRKNKLDQTSRSISELLFKAFRMIGRVHSLGVCHGHPHSNNIVVRGNQVGLIDFKYSRQVPKEIWKNPDHIFFNFKSDYNYLSKFLKLLVSPQELQLFKALFSRLVARYPCTQEIKTQVLKKILDAYA